jgi:hypothetical protein
VGSFPLSRRFPTLREAVRGTCIGVWRLDSALARLQPPKPRPSVSRRRQRRDRASLPREAQGGASALVAVPPFFGLASEAYCVPRELVMRMFERGYRQAITKVRASGQIGESQYVVFEDGAVVIETPKRVRRFNNLQELMSQARSSSARPSLRSV